MVRIITSKDNKNIKLVRQLGKKSFRYEARKFVAEGRKLVMEAVCFAAADICFAVMAQSFFDSEKDFVQNVESKNVDIFVVSDAIFNDISDTDTPQGVLAVVSMKEESFYAGDGAKEVLVLDGVSEPGNMGAAIRTAEACGY